VEATLSRFAPIKINLFLEVLGKRADGFHEIVTVMETLAIGDTVCATPAETTTLEVDRDDVPTGPENTIFKIAAAAERRLGRPLNAKFRLTKRTPPQSGLGAGSSDAAAGLDLLLASHGLAPSLDLKREIAAEAGSDVPFFFGGGVATCTGRGERIEPTTARGARHVVLVLGGVACSSLPSPERAPPRATSRRGSTRLEPARRSRTTTGPSPSIACRRRPKARTPSCSS
jgi:4-diphosphocytidyl-2-C-methyl-D-erythritol kinase